jgi:hypothetical protein
MRKYCYSLREKEIMAKNKVKILENVIEVERKRIAALDKSNNYKRK